MSRKTIRVMPREGAEAIKPDAQSVCISITDRHRSDAQLQAGWRAVLRLKFDDIECEGAHYLPLSSREAQAVLDFAHEHRDCDVVVHCEWGHSRSVGVGVFLSAWLNRPLSANIDRPNNWVISKLCTGGLRRSLHWRDGQLLKVCLLGPLWFARKNLAASTMKGSDLAP